MRIIIFRVHDLPLVHSLFIQNELGIEFRVIINGDPAEDFCPDIVDVINSKVDLRDYIECVVITEQDLVDAKLMR